eukprot:TRINITY_DN936_c0_g4_i6.p2 TRINITY_DN936_c0_g4~~TRINITY_DN936_c0_g4_i6.p2  ORF type:complete len:186 (-),score=38.41 TRINITY_DN936_c0_g4_i6:1321-1878(-)
MYFNADLAAPRLEDQYAETQQPTCQEDIEALAAYNRCIKEEDYWQLFKGLGYMKLRGLSYYTSKAVLPSKYTCSPRCILAWTLIYAAMILMSNCMSPGGLYSSLFYSSEGPRVTPGELTIIYNIPSLVYIAGIEMVFASFAYYKLIVALIIGTMVIAWHVVVIVLSFAAPGDAGSFVSLFVFESV